MTRQVPPDSFAPREGLISVAPLGQVEDNILRVVADSVQGLLRLPVDLLTSIPLPSEAFIPARNQYNAMTLIKFLDQGLGDHGLKVLGVTNYDITNPILTYVFGEAYMDGRSAIMSCRRLRLARTGEPVAHEHFLDRVVKVAIHEIGHTFNIPHCHNDRCVMRASNTLADLDAKLNYLCGYCELFLSESLTKALVTSDEEKRRQRFVGGLKP